MRKERYCPQCGRKHTRSNNRGLCRKHEWQLVKFGEFQDSNPRNKFDPNAFKIEGDAAIFEVYEYPTWNVCTHFIIDSQDVEEVSKYKWSINKDGYVVTAIKGERVLLHRLLLEALPGTTLDHIDRNPLNNRRSNIRVVTPGENSSNRNSYNNIGAKGVEKNRNGKYFARFRVNNKRYYSGVYNTVEEASFARYILEQMFSPIYLTPSNLDLHESLSQEQKEIIIYKLKNHYNK